MSDVALADHAFLSDCGAAALVTRDGSVDWLCLPRFDSPSVFGRLLDETAGHFRVAPATPGFTSSWAYRESGLVLDTTWSGPTGEVVVTDALALGPDDRGHGLGSNAPGVLLRRVRCTRGEVQVEVDYAPRPEYGLVHPRLSVLPGRVLAEGGSTNVTLSTRTPLDVHGSTARGVLTLTERQDATFAVEQTDPWGHPAREWSPRSIRRRLRKTERGWHSWSRLHQDYDGPLRDQVLRSGVVLQGLTHARTGALVAAPTTSLPEGVGTGRTWDYRFTWVRDASMTLQGLQVAACPREAVQFFAFLARAAATQLDRGLQLQIMFGIGGERDLTERVLPHLRGWRDSGPVRVGNGAWTQRQVDVYGSLLDAAYSLRAHLVDMDPGTRSFLIAVVDAAASRWTDDDQGIWEVRGAPRPFLHSKLMCWVALDRGLALAGLLRIGEEKAAGWRAAREAVRTSILQQGWHAEVGAFTQSFGSAHLDASALLLATTGFLPPDDARVLATIDAVESGLSDDRGLLYRYRSPDGFAEPEGTFLLCTFWLAQALACTDQVGRARVVLERAATYASGLGLLSEQVDPDGGELWGNFPQAFSHLGLVVAAQALAEAEQRAADLTTRP